MTCSECGHEKATNEFWEFCGNPVCVNHLVSLPRVAAPSFRDFTGDESALIPPQKFTQIYPVIQTRPEVPLIMSFCFGGEGTVDFTHEEMLALQRVARAQLELEKRRGGRL